MSLVLRTSTVVDQYNRPVHGALVEIRQAGALISLAQGNPLRTDHEGTWTAFLAAGSYNLTIKHGVDSLAVSLNVPSIVEDVGIETVTGIIRDQNGNPIPAHVAAFQNGIPVGSFVANALGQWSGILPSGEISLIISHAGRHMTRYIGLTGETSEDDGSMLVPIISFI
jgi:hypothetical protein